MKRDVKEMKKILTLTLILICCLTVGCGKEEKSDDDKKSEPTKEESYETVGNESKDALKVLMVNQTGQEIVGMSVKGSQEAEYPANMLRSGQTISPDEKVMFYYMVQAVEEDGQSSSQSEGSSVLAGAAMNFTYNLQVTYADGSIKEMLLFPLEDMEEVTLCREEEILYLTYISKKDGSEISTKEAEAAAAYNKAMAASVAEQIQQLGETTLENEEAIRAVRAAYDALPEEVKPQVFNAQELVDRELLLEELKQQAEQRAAEEQAAAQRAAEEQAAAQRAAEEQAAAQQTQGTGTSGDSQNYGEDDVSQRTDDCLGDVLINN